MHLGADLSEYLWTEGIVYYIKILSRMSEEQEQNILKWPEPFLQQTQVYEISVWTHTEIWIILYVEECLCAYKVCTDILFHVENCNKLQYSVPR